MTDSEIESDVLSVHTVAAARLWAANQFPYLASAIFALSVEEAPGIESVQVDQWWRVHADPVVATTWSVEQLGGELIHLGTHLLRDHASRAQAVGFTDPAELHHWVEAADAELNDDLPAELPRGQIAIKPADLGCPNGRLAEEYYQSGQPRDGSFSDCGSGAHGQTAPWEPPPPRDGGTGLEKDQQELVRQRVAADIQAHDAADVPEGLLRWAENRRRSSVGWRTLLAAELRRSLASVAGAVDYSYARPSRRASAAGNVILPSLRKPEVSVAVVCDTSASVDENLLGTALSEIEALVRSVGTRGVQVIACDDAVHAVTTVRRADDVTLFGGGGTDMGVGLAVAAEQRPVPQVVVVLTDGFTPWPDKQPSNVTVLVGLLETADESSIPPPPPSWCRTVHISAGAGSPP